MSITAMKQVLSAIEFLTGTSAPMTNQQKECWPVLKDAITTLRTAIAEAEKQEPVAWLRTDGMKAMTNDEKEAWIESGNADISEDYTIPLHLTQAQDDEPEGPLVDGWQITLADGHAGYGVYAHMTDYPDEGAILLLEVPQPAPKQEPRCEYCTGTGEVFGKDGPTICPGCDGTGAAPPQAQPEVSPEQHYMNGFTEGVRQAKAQAQPAKPLTNEQITTIARAHWGYAGMNTAELAFARAIEAAHNIKEQP